MINACPKCKDWFHTNACLCGYIDLKTGCQIIALFKLFYAFVMALDKFREFQPFKGDVPYAEYVSMFKVLLAVLSSICIAIGLEKKKAHFLRVSAILDVTVALGVPVAVFVLLSYNFWIEITLAVFNIVIHLYFCFVALSYANELTREVPILEEDEIVQPA